MNARFLLGIHETNSPTTQHLSLFLLTVISVPYVASPTLSSMKGSVRPLPPTMEQRERAERTLRQAQKALLQKGIAPEDLKALLRMGYRPTKL